MIRFAEPSLVKTAPNTFEATARNSTMAEVTMVPMAALVADLQVEPAVDERQQRGAEGAARGGLGRRRQAADDGARA